MDIWMEFNIILKDVAHGLELKMEWFHVRLKRFQFGHKEHSVEVEQFGVILNETIWTVKEGSIGIHMEERYDLIRQANYRHAISISHDGEKDQGLDWIQANFADSLKVSQIHSLRSGPVRQKQRDTEI